MKIFTIQTIKNLTSSSTIRFEDINEHPTIVYVGIDPTQPDGPGCRIGTLFMSMMYQHLNEQLSTNGKGTLNGAFVRPMHYIIDEFGNLPKMGFINKIFSLDRSKNIHALVVIQAIQQMRETYNDNKMFELLNSANEIIVCSLSDPAFAKTLSERAGTG
jgi:type IV secretion system protein VirD4